MTLRRFVTLFGMAAGIRASALDANDAALVVDAERAGAVGVAGPEGDLVMLVDPANRAGLFLGEEDRAVLHADQAVGVVGPLPDELPLGSGRNDAGNRGDRHLLLRAG